MIPDRMARPVKLLTTTLALIAVALGAAACGTERISVPKSNVAAYNGAVLFSQRCAGCHTISFAGTHGSAENVRDRAEINGPNFDQRCERPITRVLYAIENGGFSGAYMPANIVVGKQAREVAQFVSQYAGRQAPLEPGATPCEKQAIGSLPPSGAGANLSLAAAGVTTTAPTSTTGTSTATSTTVAPSNTTTTSSATTPAATTPATGNTIDIAASPSGALMFSTKTLTVAKAGKVTIAFTNKAPEGHNFTLATSAGKVLVATPTFMGGTKTVSVTLAAGTYTYYCSVPGHRQAGMQGTLTVK
jgi:plastocyanin/mono/diheme cytochrome c family protein